MGLGVGGKEGLEMRASKHLVTSGCGDKETVKGAPVLCLLGNDSSLLFTYSAFTFYCVFYTHTLPSTLYFWKKLFGVKRIDFSFS